MVNMNLVGEALGDGQRPDVDADRRDRFFHDPLRSSIVKCPSMWQASFMHDVPMKQRETIGISVS